MRKTIIVQYNNVLRILGYDKNNVSLIKMTIELLIAKYYYIFFNF